MVVAIDECDGNIFVVVGVFVEALVGIGTSKARACYDDASWVVC